MTDRERCPRCDRPVATQDDYDTIPEGGGEHLCWWDYGGQCEPIDWRARCIAAERCMKVRAMYEGSRRHDFGIFGIPAGALTELQESEAAWLAADGRLPEGDL